MRKNFSRVGTYRLRALLFQVSMKAQACCDTGYRDDLGTMAAEGCCRTIPAERGINNERRSWEATATCAVMAG